jgi:hypothetical protein
MTHEKKKVKKFHVGSAGCSLWETRLLLQLDSHSERLRIQILPAKTCGSAFGSGSATLHCGEVRKAFICRSKIIVLLCRFRYDCIAALIRLKSNVNTHFY